MSIMLLQLRVLTVLGFLVPSAAGVPASMLRLGFFSLL